MNFKFPLKNFMFVLMMLSIASMIAPISSFASIEFDSEINLSLTDDSSDTVQIVEDGNIYVVWEDGKDIFFKHSIDNGDNFEATQNLSNTSGIDSKSPQIAALGSNVSVVWYENGEIIIKSSSDGGSNFGDPINLSDNTGFSLIPQIAMTNSNIFVTWADLTDGNWDVFFTKSTGPNDPFDSPVNLSSSQTLSSLDSQIAADGSDVFVTWADDTPNTPFSNRADILLSSSTSNGESFLTMPFLLGPQKTLVII
jgi:hypothetical protein